MSHSIWAVVPAAGIGKRMQSSGLPAIPKQYMLLSGRPVLEHTLDVLLKNDNISGVVIALQSNDEYFSELKLNTDKPVIRAKGGKERADSVLNAINTLIESSHFNADEDWLMVHDAVRACLRQQDIDKLVQQVGVNKNGGLLALPVRDTMKRQHETGSLATVSATVDRENLWHALTPQYFPTKSLKAALEQAIQDNLAVTDESSAMELAGYSPLLVIGSEDNIKITRPDDLRLAHLYLQSRTQ